MSADWSRLPEPPTAEEEAAMRRQALAALKPHTLPTDAPGAWIRAAIEAEEEQTRI